MAFSLSELTNYSNVIIQCHDNPDADALASGFALKWYLNKRGINARFIYGGKNTVKKSNLVIMMNNLEIQAEHVDSLNNDTPELLITVDCQYGESNVTRFEAQNVAVIDHHQVAGRIPDMADIRSNYGSCSTILYSMLADENIDINEDPQLATALYYGLMTDTNGFSEIYHPCDKDLRDFAKFNSALITKLKNSNLSRDELIIAGMALESARFYENYSYAIVETAPCDPNILGIISDMLLEVDSVSTCIAYSMLPYGTKLSVRSCVKEVKANELAGYIADGYGGGGGHTIKAGGFLKKELLEGKGIKYEGEEIALFLNNRMKSYFDNSKIIYASEHEEDISEMKHYVKKEVKVGYVEAIKLAKPGSTVKIRTLEGDVEVTVKDDVYIIIGVEGEIYPITKKKFEASYRQDADDYVYTGEYPPAVIDIVSAERIPILTHAKSCIAKGGSGIYARKLEGRVKVFTSWDPDNYYLGVPGDYLAVRADDHSDIYVIAAGIFDKTYMAD